MGISFYIGRTGSGKTSSIQKNIIEELKKNPAEKRAVIYLVPDQMTFQAEHHLVKSVKGITRAHVLSFSRMAWRVLKETGGITKTYLQTNGIHMMLRKVMEEEHHHLRFYKNTVGKHGFIEQFHQFISELKQQMVSTEDLQEKFSHLEAKLEKTAQERTLTDKLHDIVTIWSKVEAYLGEKYAGTEDYLRLLAEKIPDSDFLEEADVYVDGFHTFTPQELYVLQQLMGKARHVTFALTLDRAYTLDEKPHGLDLFYQTALTYQKLNYLCRQADCDVEDTITFSVSSDKKRRGLYHLEQNFEKHPTVVGETNEELTLHTAVNRRTEIESTAREIMKLVQQENYRFKDIAVISRNMEDYQEMLQTSFLDYNIPLFTDHQRTMLHHPVIECIRSTLETISERWRYEPLFRALKTDMFFSIEEDWETAREETDLLENYVLAYGVKEKHWKQREAWKYNSQRTTAGEGEEHKRMKDKETEKWMNRIRYKLSAPLLHLENRMKKGNTIRDYCTILFAFLEDLHIPQKIERLRDKAVNNGDLAKAREHEQVWGAVIELLEQMVEISGEEKTTFSAFQKIMDTGLESMTFSIVPPALDQVTAADMERSRLSNVRVIFLLGVNEGILPASIDEEGVLDDGERQWFESQGMELAEDSGRRLLNEQFLIYRAMSIASDKLYVSYPLADEEGKTLQPSVLINQLKDMFPELEEKLLFNEPSEYDDEKQETFVGPYRKTLSFLTYQLQLWRKGYPISPIWWDVYNWYLEKNHTPEFHIAMQSLFYKNQSVPLSETTSKQLYGEKLKASVSRVEQFEACAFSQFVSYGLRLKERDVYQLEAPDIGQLFHGALKEMAASIRNHGKEWASLSIEECREIAKECARELMPTIQREILLSSSRYGYLQHKLEETVIRAAEILSKQAKVSGFSPYGLELGFGPREELPPLRFTLPDGTEMEVAGRIDRMDKAEGENGVYVRIIDYKSSQKDIRLSDVYFGLALQMLVYLDVVLSFSEEWIGEEVKPAGVLYFHVHNPFIQAKQKMGDEELEKEFLKRFKMKGLLMAEEEAVRLMDQTLSTGHSQVVPAAIKKDGSFYSSSSVLPVENFESLRTFIRRKLEQIGYQIIQGTTDIKPFKNKQKTACTFCKFQSICQFDTSFDANQYRILSKDDKEIQERLFETEKEGEKQNGCGDEMETKASGSKMDR